MKLIDILVEETIENGWSWPERANCITQDRDREIMPATCQPCVAKFEVSFNRWFLNGSRIDCFIADVLASDYETAIITREQYEAALAAKNDGWIEWVVANTRQLAQTQLWMSNLRMEMCNQDTPLVSIHGSTNGHIPTSSPTACTSRRKQSRPKRMTKPT